MARPDRVRTVVRATVLSVVTALTAAGCVFVRAAAEPGGAAPTGGEEVLRVAVFNNYPPAQYVDRGRLTGWMIELLGPIARESGLRFELVQITNFSTLVPGLRSGRFDAVAANLTVSAERTRVLDMVTVDAVGTGFSTATGGGVEVRSPLDVCGRDVGLLSGSVYEAQLAGIGARCAASGRPAAVGHHYPDSSAAVLAVGTGRVDVFMGSYSEVVHSAAGSGRLTVQPYQFAKLPEAIALPKGSPYTGRILAAVEAVMAGGEYEALLRRWKVPDIAVPRAELNPEVD